MNTYQPVIQAWKFGASWLIEAKSYRHCIVQEFLLVRRSISNHAKKHRFSMNNINYQNTSSQDIMLHLTIVQELVWLARLRKG